MLTIFFKIFKKIITGRENQRNGNGEKDKK